MKQTAADPSDPQAPLLLPPRRSGLLPGHPVSPAPPRTSKTLRAEAKIPQEGKVTGTVLKAPAWPPEGWCLPRPVGPLSGEGGRAAGGAPASPPRPPRLRGPPYLFQVAGSQQRRNQPFNRGTGDLRSFLKALGRNQAVRTQSGSRANVKQNIFNIIQSSSVWLKNKPQTHCHKETGMSH